MGLYASNHCKMVQGRTHIRCVARCRGKSVAHTQGCNMSQTYKTKKEVYKMKKSIMKIVIIFMMVIYSLAVIACNSSKPDGYSSPAQTTAPRPTPDPNKEKDEFIEKAKKQILPVILAECRKDDKKIDHIGGIDFSKINYDSETFSGALLYGTVLCVDVYGQPVHSYTFSANYSAKDSDESWAFVNRTNNINIIY